MTLALRIVLIVTSVIVSLYVLRKIRKAQLNIDDAFYWIAVAVILLVMSIFPIVPTYLSTLIGIESPSNFVFLVMIFLAFVKLFEQSIEFSIQKYRLNKLIQKIALQDHLDAEPKDGDHSK
ncbi:MAG: DUF2304 domain-containing protein [Clostridia bacterium]|nr:DUF2304 domain-containing protein [Clostridia bacterium]